MPRSTKPAAGSAYDAANPLGWGPYYPGLEGTGSAADVSSVTPHAASLTLNGGAAWSTDAQGPILSLPAASSSYLSAADGAALRRPTTALTLFVRVRPTAFPSIGVAPLYAGKKYGYGDSSLGIRARPSSFPGDTRAEVTVDVAGTPTPIHSGNDTGTLPAAGADYDLFARWSSGSAVRLTALNPTTQAVIFDVTGTTTATGTIAYDANPFLAFRYPFGSTTAPDVDNYLDGKLLAGPFITNLSLSDAEIAAASADPFAPLRSTVSDPPGLAEWEAGMAWIRTPPNVSTQWTGYDASGKHHYDPPDVVGNVLAYTGNSAYVAHRDHAVSVYRDQGVLSNGGGAAGYHAYADGNLLHYELTGDAASRDAVLLVRRYAAYAPDDSPLADMVRVVRSREVAFSIQTKLCAECLGHATSARIHELAVLALAHIDFWTAAPGSRIFGMFVRPFMVALTCDALIRYWTRYRHAPDTGAGSAGANAAAIPAAVKKAADWLWTNTWYPAGGTPLVFDSAAPATWAFGTFRYTDVDSTTACAPVAGTVTAATSGTAFRGSSGLSSQAGFFRYACLGFTTGALASQGRKWLAAYDATTKDITIAGPGFSQAPAVGDAFKLYDHDEDYDPDHGFTGFQNSGSTGAAPDLNNLVAPVYARLAEWMAAGVLTGTAATYVSRHDDAFGGSTVVHGTIDKLKTYNQIYRWSIRGLAWRERALVPWPAPASCAVTLSSTVARAGEWSKPHTIAFPANTDPGRTVAYTSAGVATLPAVVHLSADRPAATFSTRGAGSLTWTNDGSMPNPPAATVATSGTATPATGYSRSAASATGAPGSALAVAFAPAGGDVPPADFDPVGGLAAFDVSVPSPGWGNLPWAWPPLAADPDAGRGGPRVWVGRGGETVTLNYRLPASPGAKVLTFAGQSGFAAPAPLTLTASAALTGYTLTGPTTLTAGVPATFTVTPDGPSSATGLVTLAGFTLSTGTLAFDGTAAAQSFTATGTAGASGTLSVACSDGLPVAGSPLSVAVPPSGGATVTRYVCVPAGSSFAVFAVQVPAP